MKKAKRINHLVALLFLTWVVVACQESNNATPAQPTIQPTPTSQMSSTPFSSLFPQRSLGGSCATFVTGPQPDFLADGGIVFWSRENARSQGLWFLPTSDNQQHLISSETGASSAVVSPDKKWLAYYPYEAEQLKVIGSVSQDPIIRPWKPDWQNGLGLHWFDNEQLAIPSARHEPGQLTLYNPFTDVEKQITPELPHLYDFRPSSALNDFALYNQPLSHVLYMGITRETGSMLILRDLVHNRELWRFIHPNAFRFPAAWHPDGTKVAIAGEHGDPDIDNFDIFIVDLQGNVSQETNLSTFYISSRINTLRWSPDGQYLAFWLQNPALREDTVPYRLHILNLETGRLVDTCFPGGVGGPLVWSPDSQQVAFNSEQTMKPGVMMALDVARMEVIQILPESVDLIGWIKWDDS